MALKLSRITAPVMTALSTICLTFLWVPLISGSFMPFEDCGSLHHLESIEISSCPTYPCHIQTGSLLNVTTTVLVQRETFNSAELVQKVYFVINSIVLEATVTPDLCSAIREISTERCLFRNGSRIKYEATVSVLNLPPLRATLWWVIERSPNEIEICYRLTVILT